MKVKKYDYVGVAEVAKILDIWKPNVYKITDLPEPVARLESGQVWERATIEQFAKHFKERRGK